MSCLCHKLLTREYQGITESDAEILRWTFQEAPHLFHHAPPTPLDIDNPADQPRKRSRTNKTAPPLRKSPRTPFRQASNGLIRAPRNQALQLSTLSLSDTAINLTKTYCYENALQLNGDRAERLDIQQEQSSSVALKIYLAIERGDLFQRFYRYVFAQLRTKHTPVSSIVQEIENALPHAKNTRQNVYRCLHLGSRWHEILQQFASIVDIPQLPFGLLCLLGSPSSWERASTEECQSALRHLHMTTDISERALELTPSVSRALDNILLKSRFVHEASNFLSHSKPPSTMQTSQSIRRSPNSSVARTRRALHTASTVEAVWKTSSITAVAEAVPRLGDIDSEDANVLLVLLSFFETSKKIPLDLLRRGATPRRRWNIQGGIEDVNPVRAGLEPGLGNLLSDTPRLISAFHKLDLASAVSENPGQAYTVSEAVLTHIHGSLAPELHSFWRRQALIVAYKSVSWRYLESAISTPQLLLPHVKHTLQASEGSFNDMSADTRADLTLTLLEASRFLDTAWKHFAVSQAEALADGLDDEYLQSSVKHSRCILDRLGGNISQAVESLDGLGPGSSSSAMDMRMPFAIGQTAIQSSLNSIQVEDLANAKMVLDNWHPSDQNPTLLEEIVLFRKRMILGRVYRMEGNSSQALAHLESAQEIAEQQRELSFDEHLRDLTCDLADTLRELNRPEAAEHRLRSELTRQERNRASFPRRSLLEVSLAEALFAQTRYDEAEKLCLDIISRRGLLKFAKLRVHVILAKIHHVRLNDVEAFAHWSQAMVAIGKYPVVTGRTTRIILLSICDLLGRDSRGDRRELLGQSRKQLIQLDMWLRENSVWYWIAGMRHWLEYLESQGSLGSHL